MSRISILVLSLVLGVIATQCAYCALSENKTYKIHCDEEYYQECFRVKEASGAWSTYFGLARVEETTESTLSGPVNIVAMWIETRPYGPGTGEGLVGGGTPMIHSPSTKTALYRVTSATSQTGSFSTWCSMTSCTP
jgi:hypothetical protein